MEDRTLLLLEFPKVLSRLSHLAVSEAGREACLALRPASSVTDVQNRTEWLAQGRTWLARSEFTMRSFPPLDGVLQYLENPAAILDLDGLWALRQTLSLAVKAIESLAGSARNGAQHDSWPLLSARAASFAPPAQSIAALTRCLSDDGFLRDEASPELTLARGEIRRLHQMCTRKVKEFIKDHGLEHYLQDEYMTLSSDRYVLPLKANFKGRLQGIIHDYSQTGETCYFEPLFLVDVNNRLQELRKEEREAELKILRYLTGLVRTEIHGVESACALLTELDVLQASCALAAVYDGRGIEFTPGGSVQLRSALHPLLFLQHRENPASAPPPVPIDLLLSGGQRGLIVSGGNAGGKTVSLKTLGLQAVMGMAGLPVPVCKGGALPYWRQIHVFIGDEQSLEDHVSTFTGQVQHLARIWESIDTETLVVLDEFGAGTDPAQGAALAQAVIDGLLERGAYVVAATHFPALKAYALSRPDVRAASVLFDPTSKKPLFRLAYDQVGASQALDVAKEHGLPESVLARAAQYLLLDGADTSALIERLNSLAVEREKELSALAVEQAKFTEKRHRLEERFEKERTQLFARVQSDAQSVLRDWKSAKISHKQALKELAQTRKSLLPDQAAARAHMPAADGGPVELSQLRPGAVVHYLPWAKNGIVVAQDIKRNRVQLDLSGITIWTDAVDIRLSSAEKSISEKAPAPVRVNSTSKAGLHLDLRGLRADVAIAELEKFIDAALLSGRAELEIIHGRGTGALRREVHIFLKQCGPVQSYQLASEEQGGDGMTLVTLK